MKRGSPERLMRIAAGDFVYTSYAQQVKPWSETMRPTGFDHDRRRFLGDGGDDHRGRAPRHASAPKALRRASPSLGGGGRRWTANDRVPRELAALGRAPEWINSPPLTPQVSPGRWCSSTSD